MATIVRAIIAYFFLLMVMRLLGRRAPNQLSPFEIIIILLFGGMASQAIIDDDKSMTNITLALFTVGMTHLAVSSVKQKFASFGKVIDGTPLVVFSNDEWHRETMEKVRIQEEDVLTQVRKLGLGRTDQIRYAIVERNGGISIIKKKGGQ